MRRWKAEEQFGSHFQFADGWSRPAGGRFWPLACERDRLLLVDEARHGKPCRVSSVRRSAERVVGFYARRTEITGVASHHDQAPTAGRCSDLTVERRNNNPLPVPFRLEVSRSRGGRSKGEGQDFSSALNPRLGGREMRRRMIVSSSSMATSKSSPGARSRARRTAAGSTIWPFWDRTVVTVGKSYCMAAFSASADLKSFIRGMPLAATKCHRIDVPLENSLGNSAGRG